MTGQRCLACAREFSDVPAWRDPDTDEVMCPACLARGVAAYRRAFGLPPAEGTR